MGCRFTRDKQFILLQSGTYFNALLNIWTRDMKDEPRPERGPRVFNQEETELFFLMIVTKPNPKLVLMALY